MKTKGFSIIGLILSLFFSTIVVITLTLVFEILSQPIFEVKLIFSIINLVIIVVLSSFGGMLASKLTVPMFTATWLLTIMYTIIQFVVLGCCYYKTVFSYYLVAELITLFMYLLIALPIIKTGYNMAK